MLRRPASSLRIIAGALLSAMTITSCGLEYLPSLVPPEHGVAEQGSFYFTASEDHDEIVFEGYELYYKLYRTDDETRLSENNLLTRQQLVSRGFLRLARDTDTAISRDLPLIEVDPACIGIAFQVSLTFPVAEEPYVTVFCPADEEPRYVRRGITYPPEEYFSEEYQRFADITEDDIGTTSDIRTQELYEDIERGEEVYLAMYALSYGRDFTDEFYSDAYYLSEIRLRLAF